MQCCRENIVNNMIHFNKKFGLHSLHLHFRQNSATCFFFSQKAQQDGRMIPLLRKHDLL